MEASIIFHFAGRGNAGQRLALVDFAQLFDPRWRAPYEDGDPIAAATASRSVMENLLISAYSFVQGGESLLSRRLDGRNWFSRHCWSDRSDHRLSHRFG